MKKVRCDAVLIQIVATEVDDLGRPIGEMTSSPTKVFRANARDFWAEVDKAVTAMAKQQPAEPAAAADPKKGGKRR